MCGIFGIYYPHPEHNENIVPLVLSGLMALQHRGEESAGIVVGDGRRLSACYKRMGLVRNLYRSYIESEENTRQNLKGYLAIAHTRYSTTGSSNINNAAPFVFNTPSCFAIAHNGNITNAAEIKILLENNDVNIKSSTDSEVAGELINTSSGKTLLAKIKHSLIRLEGSYSFIIATKDSLIGIRDPLGNRPLSYAEFNNDGIKGYAISSESSSFNHLNIKYKREIKPGELIVCNKKGVKSYLYTNKTSLNLCGLEIAYLMRPDSRINGIQLDEIRRKLGEKLAQLYPPPRSVDFITYIPESAKSASEGYAEGLSKLWGKPIYNRTSILKNRYGSINGAIRGFISPNHEIRKEVALGNYHPFDILKGKEIVLVDDSIIRGTTTRGVIQTIRKAVGDLKNGGAKKIHLRIIFPPVVNYCPLGTDINESDLLIAKNKTSNKQIAELLNADTLEYLPADEFSSVIRNLFGKKYGLCLGCVNNIYPIADFRANKLVFEK